MLLEEKTNTAMRILVQLAMNKYATFALIKKNINYDGDELSKIIDILIDTDYINEIQEKTYKLKINPNTTTLHDVALVMNDKHLSMYTDDEKLPNCDSLDDFYNASKELNVNWIKMVTVSELACCKKQKIHVSFFNKKYTPVLKG